MVKPLTCGYADSTKPVASRLDRLANSIALVSDPDRRGVVFKINLR